MRYAAGTAVATIEKSIRLIRKRFSILNEGLSVYILRPVNDETIEQQEMDLLRGQYQALLEISEAIASHQDLDQLFHDLAPRLHRVVQFDFVNLILYEPTRKVMKSHVLETPDPN